MGGSFHLTWEKGWEGGREGWTEGASHLTLWRRRPPPTAVFGQLDFRRDIHHPQLTHRRQASEQLVHVAAER